MPNSPRNSMMSVSNLRSYLKNVMPAARFTDATIDSEYQPLLLFQTDHVVAGFAFSNGDMRSSYDALYGGFKKYYAEQAGQWDTYDLAFVFCVQPGEPNIEEYCSKIETDVYFCRKFVVPISSSLGESLARLPFLPLETLGGDRPLRPASAQTFLQQCDVPALLAKFLVVQQQRSPDGIVADCINGRFGEPIELTPATNAHIEDSGLSAEATRLEKIKIKNFRAYRRQQTFELGADVTVLYGPNGFGKTSFFDAIDFAVTGEIGRINSFSESHFRKTAQHLDSGTEESVVSLSFRSGDVVREITRSVANRKKPLLDDQVTDRKSILSELTGGKVPASDRVDNFISLFRATHLFSQEQQELVKEFKDDCHLSEEIVGRMLAFEDYNSAVNKVGKVRDVLQRIIKNANTDIQTTAGLIAKETIELEQLSETTKSHANVEVLNAEIEALQNKLEVAGIAQTTGKPDTTTVRGWRTLLEARYVASQNRSKQLSSLIKDVASLPRMRTNLTGIEKQIEQKGQALNVANEKSDAAELVIQQADKRLAEIKLLYTKAKAQSELLEWVRTNKPVYTQNIERLSVLKEEINRVTDSIAIHRATEEKVISDLHSLESVLELDTEKLENMRAELSAVQRLIDLVDLWQRNIARLTIVIESEQTQIKSLESLRNEGRDILLKLTSENAELARMSREVAEAEKGQSELKILLSQLQVRVQTGTCPLCGEDHGSKDALIQRIQKCVVADSTTNARAKLSVVQERAKQLAEMDADIKQRQKDQEHQIAELRKERTRLNSDISQFTDSALKLGMQFDGANLPATEQLLVRHKKVNKDIEKLNKNIQENNKAKKATYNDLANTKSIIAKAMAEVTDHKATLSRLQEESGKLRDDPRLLNIDLDIDIEEEHIAEFERINRDHLADIQTKAVKFNEEVTQKKSELSMLNHETKTLDKQLSGLRKQHADLKKSVMLINTRINDSNLPEEISEDALLNILKEEAREQEQTLELRDSVSNIEIVIDAATTAAALTRLKHNIRDMEKKRVAATQQRNDHQPWLKYFNELSRIVSNQQNNAIENFTREYGPRTSVIQRRLRAVYGFDEVEIQSSQSMIRVRVKRHGEELRPNDYFSQSQLQTLFLGLFLTACISQTWSTFSPVFLDDPVTHFDDLNTYALLDLIVGLLESEFGNRQFIISTCDKKLLQLARQKFRHLGNKAKFYQFSAFSTDDGPVIGEIPTSPPN